MYYVILGTDVAGSLEKRIAARPEHLARLTQLRRGLYRQYHYR